MTTYTNKKGFPVLLSMVVPAALSKKKNMIAQMCLLVAEECIANEFFRVASGANIAGPSRSDVSMLMWFGAVEITPQ